jgi:hypothetical protein
MSFRRTRDNWDEFLEQFGPELRLCGVPEEITRDRARFLVLLEHGYDDRGRFANRPSQAWSIEFLEPNQASQFADFVSHHFGGQYHNLIAELRCQAGRVK